MWPWEHVAFAYVLYSLSVRAWHRSLAVRRNHVPSIRGRNRTPAPRSRRDSLDGAAVFALAFGGIFPDAVDKPLAWTVGLFDSGYAVAHSLVALPLLAAAALVAFRRIDRTPLGVAFLVGHVSHLVGDVIYPVVEGDPLAVSAVLWPFVRSSGTEASAGFLRQFARYFTSWYGQLRALDPGPLLAFEAGLALLVVALWVADGAPGVAEIRSLLGRAVGYRPPKK